MAFAQQRRRTVHRSSSPLLLDSDKLVDDQRSQAEELNVTETSLVLSPGITLPVSSCPSDSDSDWHVVRTAQPPALQNSRYGLTSPNSQPSESDSLRYLRPSDTESFSDVDAHSSCNASDRNVGSPTFSNLPSHDGTGMFVVDAGFYSDTTSHDEADSPAVFARVVHRLLDNEQLVRTAELNDFEPETESTPNILLPHGGINPPSFISRFTNTTSHQAHYHANRDHMPSIIQIEPEEPLYQERGSLSLVENDPSPSNRSDDTQPSHISRVANNVTYVSETSASRPNIKVFRRRRRNLDSIPTHHPTIPGSVTSLAILSTVWNNVRRLTTHLIEDDTNSSETLSSLMSEAAFEGCLPFNSHLHMDFGTSMRSSASRMDGVQWLI